MKCAECEHLKCRECDNEFTKTRDELISSYSKNNRKIIEASYAVISKTKGKASRVEELILFSKKMGYKKLGLAFCKALAPQARILNKKLKEEGFEVESVCCKICEIDKEEISVPKINPSQKEPSCNPLVQAEAINKAEVDMTITVGFCVGHDMIFSKNIKSQSTALIVKDRKHAHNPAEALK